jgi:hypothetical protein
MDFEKIILNKEEIIEEVVVEDKKAKTFKN